MRQVILVFAVLALLAIGVIVFNDVDTTRVVRTRPLIGVVHGRSGVAYQVKDDDYRLVVSFPKDWNEQSQGNSGNARNYSANATFAARRGGLSATVQRNSYNPTVVTINGTNYDLAQGTVFRIRATKPDDDSDAGEPPNGTPQPPMVEVIQFPFAPLEVTPNYIEELNKYFIERGFN